MRRVLNPLLGRSFKASKFRQLVNLAFSRLASLQNQRHERYSQVRADVIDLLHLGLHKRALSRCEQLIKQQNVLDAYDMIEGYLNLLIERINLLRHGRECPDELKEAVSGLLFAASRCGDFPELGEIKSVLASRFGKEFTGRAVELRNNSGVSHQIMQKLSTRQPSLESRMNVLTAIASENDIALQLDEAPLPNQTVEDNGRSGSVQTRQKNKSKASTSTRGRHRTRSSSGRRH